MDRRSAQFDATSVYSNVPQLPHRMPNGILADMVKNSRASADHFRRAATAWMIVFVVSLMTILVSIGTVWGDRDTTVGLWLDQTFNSGKRVSPGGMFGAHAVVHSDGSYAFYPEGKGLIPSEYPEHYEKDVSIFLNFRSRAHGWFGRTRYTRPLNFHFSARTTEGTPVPVSDSLRERLREEIVPCICQPILAVEHVTTCPYVEILESGTFESRSRRIGVTEQYDNYRIEEALIGGYVHNLLTLLACALLLISFFGACRASTRLYRWHRNVREQCCPSCGYDMHGLPQPRCPECGAPL